MVQQHFVRIYVADVHPPRHTRPVPLTTFAASPERAIHAFPTLAAVGRTRWLPAVLHTFRADDSLHAMAPTARTSPIITATPYTLAAFWIHGRRTPINELDAPLTLTAMPPSSFHHYLRQAPTAALPADDALHAPQAPYRYNNIGIRACASGCRRDAACVCRLQT